jgi:plasmid maintenance system antidote protein VapI
MEDRGISTATLAAAIGIQSATLQNFRDGHRRLPDDVLQELARQLNTSANFLLDRSDDPRPGEPTG